MKKLKREIRLWLITVLVLWVIKLTPNDCTNIKIWLFMFPKNIDK